MSLRYRCLVLDHDDTVVDSTATIHHPCFQAFLDEVRPGARIDLETYLLENFTGSFPALCRGRYGLTEAEMARTPSSVRPQPVICTRWPRTLAAAASSVPATVTAFFCTCQPW